MARLGSMTSSPAASVSGHSLVREGEGGRRTNQGVVMEHDRRTYVPVRGYCGGGLGRGCGICLVNGAMDDLMIHYQTIPLPVLIKTTSISLLIPQGPPTQLYTVSDE